MAKISESEYRGRWLSPTAAADTLKKHGYSAYTVRDAILNRAKGGRLKAVAEGLETTLSNGSHYSGEFELLDANIWSITSITPIFWESGDAIFNRRSKSGGPDFSHACTGIRFDPDGIANMAAQKVIPANPLAPRTDSDKAGDAFMASLETLKQLVDSAPAAPPQAELKAAVTKAPASDATLNAWWSLYKTLREAHQRDDDDMRAHFEQCCPDKSVTRLRLRGLRGRQKPGPKANPAE